MERSAGGEPYRDPVAVHRDRDGVAGQVELGDVRQPYGRLAQPARVKARPALPDRVPGVVVGQFGEYPGQPVGAEDPAVDAVAA